MVEIKKLFMNVIKNLNTSNEKKIAEIYNDMAEEYDDIQDLWYGWLLARLHFKIVQYLSENKIPTGLNCLDVGCGTGFQSVLLSLCGHKVTGIDISQDLLEKAKAKSVKLYESKELFTTPYDFINDIIDQTDILCNRLRNNAPIQEPSYQLASATELPFENNQFDLVNCCGSVLSSIENYEEAIKEISRVLKPGGILILEVENKYNLDLFYPALDKVLFGVLDYDQPFRKSMKNIFSKPSQHAQIDFPFSMHEKEIKIPIWLFSSFGLKQELRKNSLLTENYYSIHNFTNILPSVLLDTSEPSKILVSIFKLLCNTEKTFNSMKVFNHFGCSSIYFCIKK